MLTFDKAKKIGVDACIQKIGYDFCKLHENESCLTYGENEGKMFCSIGISGGQDASQWIPKLTSYNNYQYKASCFVDMETGKVDFIEASLPDITQ